MIQGREGCARRKGDEATKDAYGADAKKGERTEKSKDVAWMSKPIEGPGVMRGVCFPSPTIATANDLDQSLQGEASKKWWMDVTTFGSMVVGGRVTLRFGMMIHLLLACSLLLG
jgi:hypothetical protein